MNTQELKIQIPEGQEIDWQESAQQEKIVFKKKDTKPRSWGEYCEKHRNEARYVTGYDVAGGYSIRRGIFESGYCTVPSKELAEAFLAMMQLMSLRQAWIGYWKPDRLGYAITLNNESDVIVSHYIYCRAFTFPTKEMAIDFMNCFKDLLEIAKPLI